jgi:NADPH2 dehydrogenase
MAATPTTKLFQPISVFSLPLAHRIVMAPLTRLRCDENYVPLPMVKEYYLQRASTPGTLIITEAMHVSEGHLGYTYAPGMWSTEQIAAWRDITEAIHAKGCFIVCQLFAPGRVALDAYPALAPSPIPFEEGARLPREMTDSEIQECIDQFGAAAKNAEAAGFDGVELHGANGYLIDQFIQDVSNQRTDRWGGSVENRSRFTVEVAKAVAAAVGPGKTAVRLSPWSIHQGMKMATTEAVVAQFGHLIGALKELGIGYLHLIESRVVNNVDVEKKEGIEFALDIWDNQTPVLVAGGIKPDSVRRLIDEDYRNWDVCVVFGRYFVSTPDLVFRLREGLEVNPYDRGTFYAALQSTGYTDYPYSKEFAALRSEQASS